jgi:hypothetical protein
MMLACKRDVLCVLAVYIVVVMVLIGLIHRFFTYSNSCCTKVHDPTASVVPRTAARKPVGPYNTVHEVIEGSLQVLSSIAS